MASAVAHSVSYDFTATNTASKGSRTDCSSWMWIALTFGTIWSPMVPDSLSPLALMASMCSGHWSISVTSRPAFVRHPPTTLPIAPAPMIPIRSITCDSSFEHVRSDAHCSPGRRWRAARSRSRVDCPCEMS